MRDFCADALVSRAVVALQATGDLICSTRVRNKYWDLRELNNVNSKLFLQWNEYKRLTCDVFHCIFVSVLRLTFFFLALLLTTVTPFKRRSQGSLVIRSGRVLDQSQQECCFRRISNPLQIFSASAQEGNLFFLSGRSARKKLYNFPFNSGYVAPTNNLHFRLLKTNLFSHHLSKCNFILNFHFQRFSLLSLKRLDRNVFKSHDIDCSQSSIFP